MHAAWDAAAPRPEARDGPHQRRLARAGFAGHQHPLARLDCDLGFLDHGGAVVERDREIIEAEDGAVVGFASVDASERIALFRTLQPTGSIAERNWS